MHFIPNLTGVQKEMKGQGGLSSRFAGSLKQGQKVSDLSVGFIPPTRVLACLSGAN